VSDSFKPRPLLIGNPYEKQQRALIDFSLMKPKKPAEAPPEVAQQH
jgi:heptose-I-phosphate ethanolaminephosphotransferase